MTEKQTAPNRDASGRFAPGNKLAKGGGRPVGTRHKLSASFLNDLALHWQEEGGDILKRVTADDPATVLRVIASLVPKELALKLEAGADGEQGIVINLLGVAPAVVDEPIDITPTDTEDIKSP